MKGQCGQEGWAIGRKALQIAPDISALIITSLHAGTKKQMALLTAQPYCAGAASQCDAAMWRIVQEDCIGKFTMRICSINDEASALIRRVYAILMSYGMQQRACFMPARICTHLDVYFELGQVDEQKAQRRHRQCSERQRDCDWRPPARLLEDVVDLRPW